MLIFIIIFPVVVPVFISLLFRKIPVISFILSFIFLFWGISLSKPNIYTSILDKGFSVAIYGFFLMCGSVISITLEILYILDIHYIKNSADKE